MVCTTITIAAPAPTLNISGIESLIDHDHDDLPKNLQGVRVRIGVVGTGSGILKLTWGSYHTETFNVSHNIYVRARGMPPRTHQICAVLSSIV